MPPSALASKSDVLCNNICSNCCAKVLASSNLSKLRFSVNFFCSSSFPCAAFKSFKNCFSFSNDNKAAASSSFLILSSTAANANSWLSLIAFCSNSATSRLYLSIIAFFASASVWVNTFPSSLRFSSSNNLFFSKSKFSFSLLNISSNFANLSFSFSIFLSFSFSLSSDSFLRSSDAFFLSLLRCWFKVFNLFPAVVKTSSDAAIALLFDIIASAISLTSSTAVSLIPIANNFWLKTSTSCWLCWNASVIVASWASCCSWVPINCKELANLSLAKSFSILICSFSNATTFSAASILVPSDLVVSSANLFCSFIFLFISDLPTDTAISLFSNDISAFSNSVTNTISLSISSPIPWNDSFISLSPPAKSPLNILAIPPPNALNLSVNTSIVAPSPAITFLTTSAPFCVCVKKATKLPMTTTNAPIPVAIKANLKMFIATLPAIVATFNPFCAAVWAVVAAACDFCTLSVRTKFLINPVVASFVAW